MTFFANNYKNYRILISTFEYWRQNHHKMARNSFDKLNCHPAKTLAFAVEEQNFHFSLGIKLNKNKCNHERENINKSEYKN